MPEICQGCLCVAANPKLKNLGRIPPDAHEYLSGNQVNLPENILGIDSIMFSALTVSQNI